MGNVNVNVVLIIPLKRGRAPCKAIFNESQSEPDAMSQVPNEQRVR